MKNRNRPHVWVIEIFDAKWQSVADCYITRQAAENRARTHWRPQGWSARVVRYERSEP